MLSASSGESAAYLHSHVAENAAEVQWIAELYPGHARYLDDPLTPDTGVGASPIVDLGAFEADARE